MRSIVVKTLAVLAVVTVSLAALELGVRVAGLTPSYQYHGLVIKIVPDVLYRAEPGGALDLNSLGYRDRELPPREMGKTRVLMVGDSFVMAMSVREEATIPRALERELGENFEVFNMGITGYGPDQALIRLREDGYELDPDIVLLGIFAANDFEDIRKNELFDVDPNGGIQRTRSNPASRLLRPLQLVPVLRNAVKGEFFAPEDRKELLKTLFTDRYDWELHTNGEAPESRRKLAIMRGVLAAFNDELTSRAVDFAVVIIPSYLNIHNHKPYQRRGVAPDQYFRLEELVASLCEELGIPFVNTSSVIANYEGEPLFNETDHHLTPLGNEIAAREAAQVIRGLLDSSSP